MTQDNGAFGQLAELAVEVWRAYSDRVAQRTILGDAQVDAWVKALHESISTALKQKSSVLLNVPELPPEAKRGEIANAIRKLRQDYFNALERLGLLNPDRVDAVAQAFDAAMEMASIFERNKENGTVDSFTTEIIGTLSISPTELGSKLHLAKSSLERLSLLVEADKLLIDSIEYDIVLRRIGEIALRTIADWCIVDVSEEDGSFRRVAVLHRDAEKSALCLELQRDFVPDRDARGVPSSVLSTGRPLLIPQVTEEHYKATSRSPRHEQILRGLGSRSYLCVPMMVDGRFLGAMTLVSSSPERAFGETDLIFAQELASRAALAIQRSKLFQDIKRAVQIREDLISIVSHDLGNPLTSIKLASSLIARMQGKSPVDGPLWQAIENIRRATEHMESLTHKLLDLSRIESGEFRLDRRPESVSSILQDTYDLFVQVAASRSIELRMDRATQDWSVDCDKDRILQVLSNLVGNALKFTPGGGVVEVGATLVEQRAVTQFSVSDSGRGIDPSDVPNLFRRFWQPKSNNGGRSGSGLGLSIVKAMVETHGGRVWVESKPGHGSRFYFTLPVAKAEAPGLLTERDNKKESDHVRGNS